MDELIAFLRARLDERADALSEEMQWQSGRKVGKSFVDEMLRDVEAKRAIVDRFTEALEYYQRPENLARPAGELDALYWTLKQLASAWSDHEAYNPNWRP